MFKSFVRDMHRCLPAEPKKKPSRNAILAKIERYLKKIQERTPLANEYVDLLQVSLAEARRGASLLTSLQTIATVASEYEEHDETRAKKYLRALYDYVLPFTDDSSKVDALAALVLDCPLFNPSPDCPGGRSFQYAPACAVAKRERTRFLVYYPLGSGKTLSALHAARTFLELHPRGRIVVLTTLSNVKTTWPANIALYLKHVPDTNHRVEKASVENVDWWFSQENKKVILYNRLIHTLGTDPLLSREALITMKPRELRREVNRFTGKWKRKATAQWRRLQKALKKLPGQQKTQSMLEATIPKGPFCLIVDECQEYVNTSARSLLVNALADAATTTLLLTATPLNDQSQKAGLFRLLRTPKRPGIDKSVLWTNDGTEKPELVSMGVRQVKMTEDEWRQHAMAVQKKTSTHHSQNAYLAKSRQACNCLTKWGQIADQISADCERFAADGGPIRIVVYSFFLQAGIEGFLSFLRKRTRGSMFENRLKYKQNGISIDATTMLEDTLEWFNQREATQNCKILLLSSRSGMGISLKNVRSIHIMEPQWSSADEEQAVGRCTRKGSHDKVPKQLEVTRWMAVPPQHARGRTADQRVRASMVEKKRVTDAILQKLAGFGDTLAREVLAEFGRS